MLRTGRAPDAAAMSTAQQLQTALEQRAIEIQQLERRLQRSEAERQRLESRQPPDVKALTAQKREINKMIGEIAELQSAAASRAGQKSSEEETARITHELETVKSELKQAATTHASELSRLQTRAKDLERDLEVKSAALQSLRLAKPTSPDESQKAEAARATQRLNDELVATRKARDEAIERSRCDESAHRAALATIAESVGVSVSSSTDTLRRRIEQLKSGNDEEANRRQTLDSELASTRRSLATAEAARDEATRRASELDTEIHKLRERAAVDADLETLMRSLRASKADATAKERETAEWRSRALQAEERHDRADADLQHARRSLANAEQQLHQARATALHDAAAGETLKTLETELASIRTTAEEQRRELHEARAARERAVVEFRAAVERSDDAKQRAVAAAKAEAEEELRRVRREHANELSTRTDEAERLRGELRKVKAANTSDRTSTTTQLEQLQERESRLTEDLREARRTADEQRQRVERLEEAAAGRSTASNDEVAELRRTNDSLRAELARVERAIDETTRQMQQKERALADRLDAETCRHSATSADLERARSDIKRLESEHVELRTQLAAASKNPKTDQELINENAKLAAQLLAASSSSDDAAELRAQERNFMMAQAAWRRERESLREEADDLKRQLEAAKRVTPITNGHASVPLPKPRKLASSISSVGVGGEVSSADESSTPTTTNGAPNAQNIKTELDKQKRLVTVLRKKLQSQAIDRIHQSRSFMT